MNSEVEQLIWVENWAGHIKAKGLSPLALALIEIARPFGFIGSQALLMAQPLLNGVIDDNVLEHTTGLLDNPDLLDRLTTCLEGDAK